jgi:hypothetical protein
MQTAAFTPKNQAMKFGNYHGTRLRFQQRGTFLGKRRPIFERRLDRSTLKTPHLQRDTSSIAVQ